MTAHDTYQEARADAQARADSMQREVGIRRMREYGHDVYLVHHLPIAAKRFGEDLRSEVVAPAGTP
jgi:L-ribulose-5-phosphate 3-epimerase UlaE